MFGCNSSCRIVSCGIESAAARVRSREKIQSARKQFREHRSAASICARRRLLDKRSNSLCKEIYEGYSLLLLFFPTPVLPFFGWKAFAILSTTAAAAFRIHLYQPRVSPRVISYPPGYYNAGRNGNRQMIHERVKRDVSRQRFGEPNLFKFTHSRYRDRKENASFHEKENPR